MQTLSSGAADSATRLHVLQVVGNGIVGGMETCVQQLIERLPRERFHVTVLCPFECRLAERLRALNVEVLVTPMPEDPPWSSIQMASTLVKVRGVDIIHAHLPNAHVLAGIVGRLTGRPVLATIHGRQLTTLDAEVQRAAGSHVNVVCQQSYFHALGLGLTASQVSCIPNGVDTALFQPDERSPAERPPSRLRQDLGIAPDAPLVGFVGRLSPEKGPEVFLRAAVLLKSLVPQARFAMVGDGPMHDRLFELIDCFGLADCLFLPGVRHDMPAIYRTLDVMVCSSHSEAMPLALLEAMASGVPVISTRVGGVPELVEPGHSGWLVEPGDFQGVADRVAHVLLTPGEQQRLGAHARRRAVERMDVDDCVQRTAQLLTDLAPRRGDARQVTTLIGNGTRRVGSTARVAAPVAGVGGAA